jgi:hypothetical protein
MKSKKSSLSVAFSFLWWLANGQAPSLANTPVLRYENDSINKYTLYNGRIYNPEKPAVAGHPYFESSNPQPTSLRYRDRDLTCVALYNIVDDILVSVYGKQLIELNYENLTEFSFSNHRFVWLMTKQSNLLQDAEGFFELLYDGKTRFYAKRRKYVAEQLSGNYVKKEFVEKDRYYIFRDGKFIPVKNKSSLLDAFADKKKILRKSAKSERLDFKRDWEKSVCRICLHYDHAE